MGNNSTKEARGSDLTSVHGNNEVPDTSIPSASSAHRHHSQAHSPRQMRENRTDLFFLGIGSNSNHSVPERRETKQERDARKLDKERQARVKERERSLKEEHVDGGFLVTMGIYTGVEDFNKAIVRQLMIERRIAPFWRGLNEYSESWTESQLIAASRGIPILAAQDMPQESSQIVPQTCSDHSVQGLGMMDLIPTNSSLATSGESSKLYSSTNMVSDVASKSLLNDHPNQSSSFRPRSKTIASLTNASQGLEYYDKIPKEVNLPHDPHVNGQPIEVVLYKNVVDCPICFLSYPPYLNKTRCCDQPVCSECFVQIKRPDPHPPELNHSSPSHVSEGPTYEAESLVSKPACCPYCQQPDFGVIYEPPGFRRGLVYINDSHENSKSFPNFLISLPESPETNKSLQPSVTSYKRRTTSISPNAPTVITTDRIRPDWAIKLANARSYMARRSAAATALHTAAYLMGSGNTDTRSFSFRSSRLARSIGADIGTSSGSATSYQGEHDNAVNTSDRTSQNRKESHRNEAINQMNRIQDIEELMVMEAIRLSLATEDERM